MPTSLTMVSHYFEKRRGFANCITITGSSVGSLLYAPLITKLLTSYGYKGCMVLLAAILLHGCICGALFRPISFYANQRQYQNCSEDTNENILDDASRDSDDSSDDEEGDNMSDVEAERWKKTVVEHGPLVGVESNKAARLLFLRGNKSFQERTRCQSENPNNTIKLSPSDTCLIEGHLKHKSTSQQMIYNNIYAKTRLDNFTKSLARSVEKGFSGSNYVIESLYTISESFHTEDHKLKPVNQSDAQDSEIGSSDNTKQKSRPMLCQLLSNICDTQILKMPLFIVFQISSGLLSAGTMLCAIFIVPHAREIGIPEGDVAMLVTIFSAVDICGRILCALISDKDWIRRSTMAASASLAVSISAHLLRFYTSYSSLIIYSVIIGAFNGVFFSLVAVIIVDYMTLSRLQSVLGFTHLCQGFSVACGFYLIGRLNCFNCI